MRTHKALARALIGTVLFASAEPVIAQTVTVTLGPVTPAAVSGKHGETVTIQTPAVPAALFWMEFGERRDRPCYLHTRWLKLQFGTNPQALSIIFDTCNGNVRQREIISVPEVANGLTGATGLKVCNNRRKNNRLKGADFTRSASLLADSDDGATLITGRSGTSFARANCKVQSPTVSMCDPDKLAVGLSIHTKDNNITGLALRCAVPMTGQP